MAARLDRLMKPESSISSAMSIVQQQEYMRNINKALPLRARRLPLLSGASAYINILELLLVGRVGAAAIMCLSCTPVSCGRRSGHDKAKDIYFQPRIDHFFVRIVPLVAILLFALEFSYSSHFSRFTSFSM